MSGQLRLMQGQFGLTANGPGAEELTYTYKATGTVHGPAGFGYVEVGSTPAAATAGTRVIGDNLPDTPITIFTEARSLTVAGFFVRCCFKFPSRDRTINRLNVLF